jgi:V/A-type H+-transporting ATPase subunit E
MSTQKVIDKILEDARKEAQEIIAQHKSEANNITKNYAERIAQKKIVIDNHVAELKNKEIMRALSQKRLDLNKKLTQNKQELINVTIAEAVKKLIEHKEYVAFLKALIKNSGETEGELLLNNTDLKRHRSELEKFVRIEKLNLRIAGANDIKGGIIIKKGKINYLGSLDIIIELLSDELAIAVSKILY